jgi:hypothetical protein
MHLYIKYSTCFSLCDTGVGLSDRTMRAGAGMRLGNGMPPTGGPSWRPGSAGKRRCPRERPASTASIAARGLRSAASAPPMLPCAQGAAQSCTGQDFVMSFATSQAWGLSTHAILRGGKPSLHDLRPCATGGFRNDSTVAWHAWVSSLHRHA